MARKPKFTYPVDMQALLTRAQDNERNLLKELSAVSSRIAVLEQAGNELRQQIAMRESAIDELLQSCRVVGDHLAEHRMTLLGISNEQQGTTIKLALEGLAHRLTVPQARLNVTRRK